MSLRHKNFGEREVGFMKIVVIRPPKFVGGILRTLFKIRKGE